MRQYLAALLYAVMAAGAVGCAGRVAAATSVPPPALIVERTASVPLLPVEVSQGYDTKIEIVLSHQGRRPRWWTPPETLYIDGQWHTHTDLSLYYRQGGTFLPAPAGPLRRNVSTSGASYDARRDRYVAYYLIDLAPLPVSADPVYLRGRVAVGLPNQEKPFCPPVEVSVLVRKPSQRIEVPAVSRDTGLSVRDVRVRPMSAAEGRRYVRRLDPSLPRSAVSFNTPDVEVRIGLTETGPAGQYGIGEQECFISNRSDGRLVPGDTSAGCVQVIDWQVVKSDRDGARSTSGVPSRTYVADCFLQLRPKINNISHGKLSLILSRDGRWSLQVIVPLHDAARGGSLVAQAQAGPISPGSASAYGFSPF